VSKYLALAAVVAGLLATAAPASAQYCLRVLCDDRPILGCYRTSEVEFCI
jgi:hypothetical protein